MKIFDFLKRTVKPFVDVRSWMGYNQLADMTRGVGEIVKRLFVIQKADQFESFEQAMQRFNLTEKDLQQRIKAFGYLAIFWISLAFIIICYGVYLAGQGSLHGFLGAIGISLIAIGQAFRYHFWLFQLKQRRLGCSFREWLNASFKGDKT